MSIFSKVKRALGFGPDDDDADDEQLFADTAESTEKADEGTVAALPPAAESVKPVEFDARMQDAIFTRIIDVFNSSLPDFFAKTVDKESQLKYLRENLDAGVKEYLDSLSRAAETYCEAQWKARQASMATELETIRARAGEIEKQSSDIKQKQLSADRQKRALTERVHDLESQLARLESEREQFELENRSLVNRLKVANVQQEDVEKLQTELNHLRLENQRMRENPDEASAAKIEALNTQIGEMTAGIESLKEQIRVSGEMTEDLRSRLRQSEDVAKEMQSRIEAKDKEIADYNEIVAQFAHVEKKMVEVDEVISRKDEKIKSQKKMLDSRAAEIEELRKTISENLRLQAEREKSLREEIDSLRPTVVSEMTVNFGDATEDSVPQISEDDLSALEQTFESDEWFTKTPPPETPSMRPPESESDFGYHAPRRKTVPPEHPNQLSLF